MATHYLIPDAVTFRAVKATGGGVNVADFTVLMLHFNLPSTDFANGDVIYPSYDGTHQGLLVPYQYTLLAANDKCPISTTTPVIVGDITQFDNYVMLTNTFSTYTKNLRVYFGEAQTSYDTASYRANFHNTVGYAIAVFTDGKVLFASINNQYNTSDPPALFTYNEPTEQTYGYMVVSVGSDIGYAPLNIDNGFVLTQMSEDIGQKIFDNIYVFSEDPYDNFPEPEDPGGDGNPDSMGPGDAIDIPSTPTISAASSGLVTLYNPTIYQLQSLANYLWSGPFDLDSFKKIFADPMDCIIGLSIVPVSVPNGAIQAITVGNISTGINVSTAAADYVEVDCGTLNVPHEFASYLDYAPFTTVDIYLPYIGVRHLDTDNIMPAGGESTRAVKVVYKVDLFSGACIAFIKCGSSVMYSFAGQCATQIPVTGNSWTELYKSMAGIASSLVGSVSVGGGGGDTVSKYGDNFHSRATLNNTLSHSSSASASSVADAVFSAKPQIDRTGTIGSAIGLLGVQKPYLIIRRPVTCIPKYMNEYSPYPSYRIRKVGDLSGHAVFEEIHLEHIPATEDEVDEIYSLLESGVII